MAGRDQRATRPRGLIGDECAGGYAQLAVGPERAAITTAAIASDITRQQGYTFVGIDRAAITSSPVITQRATDQGQPILGEDRTTGLALGIKGQGSRGGDPTLDDQIGQGQRRAGRDDAAIAQRIEGRRLGEGVGNGPVAGGITAGQGQRFVNAHQLGRRRRFDRLAAATR